MGWMTQLVADVRGGMTSPVFMKEMRSRMRGGRGNQMLVMIAGLATLLGLFVMVPQWYDLANSFHSSSYTAQRFANIGRSLFITLTVSNALLCALIAPGITAGAIAVERERDTLELLLLTRLSSANIILGKLFSALSFLVIALVCSLPVMAIGFVFGGVDPAQLLWTVAIIIATATLFAAIGLFTSVRFPKLATCTVQAYLLALLSLVFIPLAEAGFMVITDGSFPDTTALVVSLGLMGLLAILPTLAVSAIIAIPRRRMLTRAGYGILWGVSTVALWLLTYMDTATTRTLIEDHVFHIGHPFIAFMVIFGGNHMGMASWLEHWFLPLTVFTMLFWTGVFLLMAVQHLERIRAAGTAQAAGR